jgi:hypothetical protein
MKKIIVSVILIAIVGLAGPKIIGGSANQKFEEFIAEVNETPGYQVEIIDSETGWFSSKATVNVGLDPMILGDMGNDPQIRMLFEEFSADLSVTMQHGPFLTLNGLGLGLLAVKADIDKTVLREYLIYNENESLYSLGVDLGLFGGTCFSDTLQGFTLRELGTVSFGGWNGEGSVSSSYVSYKGEMESFTAVAGGEKLEIESVGLDLEAEDSLINMLTTSFYDSAGEFTIGSVSLDTSAQGNIVLKNMAVTATTEVTNGGQLMDMGVSYGLDELLIPGFNATDLLLKVELLNLEKTFFSAMQNAGQSAVEVEELSALFNNNLLPQLKASPEFNITELSGNVDGNSFSGKALIKLTGIKQMPIFMEDPSFWLSKLVVDAQLEMERAMAVTMAQTMLPSRQQAEATVNMLTAQGMVNVNARNNLEVSLTVNDSQVTLNGNLIPLPY